MNHILLTVGIAIILVALAAIAAPFVIDWSTQRAFFEAQASRVLGQPVTIEGDIDARLLPEPSFRFDNMTIGTADPDGGGVISVGSVAVRLAPGSLLKRRAEITGAQLDQPGFAIAVAEDGTLVVPPLLSGRSFDPSRVSADTIQVTRGTVTIVDTRDDREWTVGEISGDAAVRSLDGPYRFDGGFTLEGARFATRIATGRSAGGRLPLKVVAEAVDRPVVVQIDGTALTDAERPVFEGDVTVRHGFVAEDGTRIGPVWSADVTLRADPDTVAVSEGSLAIGPPEREIRWAATAEIVLKGAGATTVALDGRQVDLDRYLGSGPEDPTTPAEALAAIVALFGDVTGTSPVGTIDLAVDAGAVIIGGEIVQDVSLAATIGDATVTLDRLSAGLPGGATVEATGAIVGFADIPAFAGEIRLDALNIVPAARWMAAGEIPVLKDAEQAIAGLSLEADVTATSRDVTFSRFEGRLREAPLSGAFRFRRWDVDRPGIVELSLDANVLDLPEIRLARLFPGLGDSEAVDDDWGWLERYSVDLDIVADTLFVGDTGVSGVVADMTVAEGTVDIRDLEIADLFGSAVSASGSIAGWPAMPEGQLTVEISATELADIMPLLDDFGISGEPGDANRFDLAAYQPASARADIVAGLTGDGARLSVSGDGRFGATEIRLDGEYESLATGEDDRFVNVEFSASNASSRRLLGQFGLPPLGVAGPETREVPGSVAVLMRGVPADALETIIDADLLGTDLNATGTTTLAAGGAPTIDLDAELAFADADALLDYAGLPPTNRPRSGRVRARVAGAPAAPAIGAISGTVGGAAVSGDLAFGRAGDRPLLAGRLDIGRADLFWLLGTGFRSGTGLADSIGTEGVWPADPIVESPFSAIDLDVLLMAETLAAGRLAIADASARLRTRQDRLSLGQMRGTAFGGPIRGNFSVRAGAGGVAVQGRAQFDEADLAALSQFATGEPTAAGRAALNVQLEGQGRSIQTLVASLTGTGRYSLENARLQRLDPDAFAVVTRAADAGETLDDANAATLFANALDGGALVVPSADGVFSVAGGVGRGANAILDGRNATVRVSGALDLSALDLDATLTLAPGGDNVLVDAQTEVSVSLDGPIEAPIRSIDVSALTGYLSVRQFEREVERIEMLQADILERQRLSRDLSLHRRLSADGPVPNAAPPPAAPEPEPAMEQPPAEPEPSAGRETRAASPAPQGGDFSSRIRSVLGGGAGGAPLRAGEAPVVDTLPPPIEIGPAAGTPQ